MKTNQRLSTIVRLIADFLDGLSDEDANALVNGVSRIEIVNKPKAGTYKTRARPHIDPTLIAGRLMQARTREEAMELLKTDGVSKLVLEALARHLDLPVLRSDSVDRLRQRIVEATIGYRINSEAIRGGSRGGD
jgi:hypothetical protein